MTPDTPNGDTTSNAPKFVQIPPSALDKKILEAFPGLVVRKDLTKGLKQNAVVPTYVLEYLLGQHCATDDPIAIESGLESVRAIIAKHYVHRKQAELVKSTIKEQGRHKVIDKVAVELNEKAGIYEARFTNLGLTKVPIPDDFVRRHPKLLVGGIWCITDVLYAVSDESTSSPWHIETLKPIQVSTAPLADYQKARKLFSTEEWMGLLLQSIGFNPEMFTRRGKLLQLVRLIPFCERNYNLIELGPKGTGKSHVYAELSPHAMLISGSEVTAPKLFVNNSNGKIGLVGFWDCICFDEFAGKDKNVDKGLVDIMKNYMANKSFSRGIEQLSAEASMVFMGNTKKSVAYMLKHSHFFDQLPDKYIDPAFFDRLHAYNPGWEAPVVSSELFSSGYGFIVDYLAEILKQLRNEDHTQGYRAHLEFASELSTRDQAGIEKTYSGLMKLLYPDGSCTPADSEEILSLAMEGRRRVREHIIRIDDTFNPHHFSYKRLADGKTVEVLTPEELQYPAFAHPPAAKTPPSESPETPRTGTTTPPAPSSGPSERHFVIPENSRGWSYRRIFADYLRGARQITIQDPYIRQFHQIRNLMEFLQLVHELVPEGDEASVRLVTQTDSEKGAKQEEFLSKIVESFTGSRVNFSWEFSKSQNLHARSVATDSGWKITSDRGLDLFQRFETGPFDLQGIVQDARLMRGAEITYIRKKD